MMLNNKCLIEKPSFKQQYDEVVERATQEHLDRCIIDGRMIADDPMQYLRSGRFAQFNANLRHGVARGLLNQTRK